MNDESDESLLSRWQQGDERAGKLLYRRYFPVVHRYFRNKASTDEFDDLVQSTFLACHRGSRTFRGESSFKTFILTVAHHVFVSYCRKRTVERKHVGPVPNSDSLSVADVAQSPFSAVADGQQARLLLASLRALPIDVQALLELYYWESLSGREIGVVLGIPEGTVRGRLTSARRQLETKMTAMASSPEELASTLSDLEGWARKVRDALGRESGE
jgi:RNA polymerase sigma-70 factor (ECF subfamily)